MDSISFAILPNEDAVNLYPTGSKFRSYEDDAGYDIFMPHDVTIPMTGRPGQPKRVVVPLGVKVVCIKMVSDRDARFNIPWAYLLMGRSSISKTGLSVANSVGLIDAAYRGELKGALYNNTSEPITIKKGQSIFQIVPMCGTPPHSTILTPDSSQAKKYFGDGTKEGMPTDRGAGGFGSTGHTAEPAEDGGACVAD